MNKRLDSAVIGIFVVGALVLVVAAVLAWGSGRLFRSTTRYVAYFEGSVNGLEVGAPVKARGVTIGKVVAIRLAFRQRLIDRRIPVIAEVDVKRLTELGVPAPTGSRLTEMIERGLRGRLESQSLITGTLFINVGWFPGTPVVLSEIDPAHGYPEIPTVPMPLAEAGTSVTKVLGNLEAVDFAGTVRAIGDAATSFNRLVGSDQFQHVAADARGAIQSYRRVADHVDDELPTLFAQLRATVRDARKTLGGLDETAGAAGRLVAPQAPLSVRLNDALADVGRAARAVRELSEYLRRNPNSLLVGKPR